MQHRLSLIQKFMILGLLALIIAALPALLYFSNSFKQRTITVVHRDRFAQITLLLAPKTENILECSKLPLRIKF